MKAWGIKGLLSACLLLLPLAGLAAPAAGPMRIVADPDLRVSYDGDVCHMEGPVAASTTDPNVLVGSSELVFPGRWAMSQNVSMYYSHDGGAEWHQVPLMPASVDAGWDNAMVAGPGGVIYFVTHDFTTNHLTVYATHDGGQTWSSGDVKDLGWDREYAAVDNTQGPYSGRIYIAGEHADSVYVVSSSDGGKTFTAPVSAYHPAAGWQAGASPSPIVLSDGTLVVPLMPYPLQSGRASWAVQNNGIVVSTDGGKTFSAFRSLRVPMRRGRPGETLPLMAKGDILLTGQAIVAFAAGPKTGIFPDRLYAAWESMDTLARQVMYVSYSDDKGITWSRPHAVDAGQSAVSSGKIRQCFPMLAVNPAGTVGLAWFDGRNAHGGQGGYDIYFTSSVDGGRTFLPSVRISSATSFPGRGVGALLEPWMDLTAFPASAKKMLDVPIAGRTVAFNSPYNMRLTGGDYATMAADSAGRFHPFWYDGRSGTFQLYTSTVRVLPASRLYALASDPPGAGAKPAAQDKNLQILYGEPQWDPEKKDYIFYVRLENTSSDTYISPLDVKVAGVENHLIKNVIGPSTRNPYPPAPIADPKTGAYGPSAVFVYPISPAHPLLPGSVTPAVAWRFHIARPEMAVFMMNIQIKGENPVPFSP